MSAKPLPAVLFCVRDGAKIYLFRSREQAFVFCRDNPPERFARIVTQWYDPTQEFSF